MIKRGEIMSRVAEIEASIEILREKLHRLVESKNYQFIDQDVMSLSERLDILLVERERCKIGKSK